MVVISLDSPSCGVCLFDPRTGGYIGMLPDRPRIVPFEVRLCRCCPYGDRQRTLAGIIQVVLPHCTIEEKGGLSQKIQEERKHGLINYKRVSVRQVKLLDQRNKKQRYVLNLHSRNFYIINFYMMLPFIPNLIGCALIGRNERRMMVYNIQRKWRMMAATLDQL